jgi:hypothetical protein
VTDLPVSQTILAQLAEELRDDERCHWPRCRPGQLRNPKRVTHVRVTVTHDGLRDMTFFTIGKGPESYDGIHRKMLQEVFGANAGLRAIPAETDRPLGSSRHGQSAGHSLLRP